MAVNLILLCISNYFVVRCYHQASDELIGPYTLCTRKTIICKYKNMSSRRNIATSPFWVKYRVLDLYVHWFIEGWWRTYASMNILKCHLQNGGHFVQVSNLLARWAGTQCNESSLITGLIHSQYSATDTTFESACRLELTTGELLLNSFLAKLFYHWPHLNTLGFEHVSNGVWVFPIFLNMCSKCVYFLIS